MYIDISPLAHAEIVEEGASWRWTIFRESGPRIYGGVVGTKLEAQGAVCRQLFEISRLFFDAMNDDALRVDTEALNPA